MKLNKINCITPVWLKFVMVSICDVRYGPLNTLPFTEIIVLNVKLTTNAIISYMSIGERLLVHGTISVKV